MYNYSLDMTYLCCIVAECILHSATTQIHIAIKILNGLVLKDNQNIALAKAKFSGIPYGYPIQGHSILYNCCIKTYNVFYWY